ncbi:MAG: lipoyl(octanoyl) transferase LipB [Longimicrobiales bacterium]
MKQQGGVTRMEQGTAARARACDVPSAASRRLCVSRLGSVPYADGLELQQQLVQRRRAGDIDDTLLLLEHPHVITLGTSSHAANVLLDDAQRAAGGIELFETGRGGDVTYHGPGQLVGYPILDLKPDRCDLHRYVRDIEEVIIRALRTWDISATRVQGLTGVWVNDEKICAIGVRVSSGWITSHGFAFNITTDLSYFGSIVPCGISDRGVTSLERVLGEAPDMSIVHDTVASEFANVFERKLVVQVD